MLAQNSSRLTSAFACSVESVAPSSIGSPDDGVPGSSSTTMSLRPVFGRSRIDAFG
jgi:hypothetical protein